MAHPPEPDESRTLCRLFPLPHVVLFPHGVLPLHIFEPRYRQMTEDALAEGDKLVAIVQLREGSPPAGLGNPPIEPVACLGRIVEHERLKDGLFNFLLLGLKRIRLVREVSSDRLYRLAEAELLEDEDPATPDDRRRQELFALFRRLVAEQGPAQAGLESLLDAALPLGVLTDLLAYALGVPAALKQALLAETRVEQRADSLILILSQILARRSGDGASPRHFPPPFSAN